MPLHPNIEAALKLLPPREEPVGTPAERRAEAHARWAESRGLMTAELPALADERDVQVPSPTGGVPVRVYRPGPGTLPAYIFLHGGGWWLGGLDESDGMCRRRAVDASCVVISVDYRLAPEDRFPAAVDDGWAVAQWVFANAAELDVDPSRVVIGGGSAGGNIAAALTLLARDDSAVNFVAQVLEVPATDLTLTTGAACIEEFASGYGLSKADLHECVDFYLGDHDPKDVLVSPMLADLHDLPPALITTAEYDPVRDDGEAYAAKLAEAGVPVTLRRFDGIVHGAMEADAVVPEVAAEYRALVIDFLRSHF
jgi:acetyl esterase